MVIPLWTLSKDPRVQFQFIIFRIEIAMTWGYYYSMFETIYGKFDLILPRQSPLTPSFTVSASCSWCLKDYMTIPTGSMYAIYGNIYHQYTPNVSIIYHTWILWLYDLLDLWSSFHTSLSKMQSASLTALEKKQLDCQGICNIAPW